jgi:hypothetical protein
MVRCNDFYAELRQQHPLTTMYREAVGWGTAKTAAADEAEGENGRTPAAAAATVGAASVVVVVVAGHGRRRWQCHGCLGGGGGATVICK